jgi:hypothetical protein
MKKINLLITAAIFAFGFTACKSTPTEAEQDAISFNNYVDSIENLTPVYTTTNWTALNDGYQMRVTKTETTMSTLSEADRQRIEASKTKYATLKTNYEIKIKEVEVPVKPSYRIALRNGLFGEGVVGDDMSFSFVTGANLLDTYRNFVNTVSDNRDLYTREDWDEIKVLYEALDTRKNTVEKEAPRGDNTKIAGLKIKFAGIKGTNRGGTKGEENREAKDKAPN